MKFVLKSVSKKDIVLTKKKTKTEEVYAYESEIAKIAFHAHPTRAWNWCIIHEQSNDAGIALVNKVIDAFIKGYVGMAPTEITI